jgi:membrane protein implicated in regulation of membrane protease activity
MKVKDVLEKFQKSTIVRRTGWIILGSLLVSLLSTGPAQGQFGLGTAAILAFLQTMNTTMQATLAVPLTAIQSLNQQRMDFEQQTIYPVSQISSVQGLSSAFQSQMSQMQARTSTPTPMAQPGTPQAALETSTLSGDVSQVPTLASEYAQVYGPTPTLAQVNNPQQISAVDMGDAQAKDALVKSVQLDAAATTEMGIASQLIQEAQSSTPGTAPMIQSQASAWILQAQAYSQGAMASLLRVRSASLSYKSLDLKNTATSIQNRNQSIQNYLRP